jgi:branched-chain amino acid transport system ATP-binding protein
MTNLLEVKDLHVGYGTSRVVQGIDFSLGRGDGVAVFGRNGVGKTTLMHALMGLLKPSAGSIKLSGKELAGAPAHQIARAGIAIIPQGRRLFPTLTVKENLMLGSNPKAGDWTLERVFDLLPRLKERRTQAAGKMSGGEQQMVAIGRALMRNPDLLLLDEPSEGLAPRIIEEVGEVLRQLRNEGMSLLVAEQNLGLGLSIADKVLIVDAGKIAHSSSTTEFRHDPETAHRLLGVL